MTTTQRHPLAWPESWKRTPAGARTRATFRTNETKTWTDAANVKRTATSSKALTVAGAIARLLDQLERLGVAPGDFVLSTNVPVRMNGLPYSDGKEPADPGAAVYFRLNKQDRCLACDKWDRIADNVAAIAQHIDALRRIDRYGVGTLDQVFAGYAALPAKGSTWRTTLGFAPDQVVTKADIDLAVRARSRTAHPDVAGGSHDAMASLTAAKAEGVRELEALGR